MIDTMPQSQKKNVNDHQISPEKKESSNEDDVSRNSLIFDDSKDMSIITDKSFEDVDGRVGTHRIHPKLSECKQDRSVSVHSDTAITRIQHDSKLNKMCVILFHL